MRLREAVFVTVCAFGSLPACKAFLVWKDPQVQLVSCEITSAVLSLLEDLAVTVGLPLDVVTKLYGEGCQVAAEKGMSQADAQRFGLQHAQIHAMKMAAERDAGAP